jgi:hypothetical protein
MAITFDGVNKLAILSSGTTELSVPELWSRWVDWLVTSDNSKYPLMLSQIGGDQIGPGKFLGLTFFLENDWKIRPYEGDHTLTITGNLFSRDGSSAIAPTIGDYQVVVNLSTSNLVDTIATGGATASEVADEVWNRLAVNNDQIGSFGQLINLIHQTSTQTAVEVAELQTKLDTASDLITTLLKYERNRTRINPTAKTMTVFDDDGITPLRVFDLKDFTGTASITEIAERAPQ